MSAPEPPAPRRARPSARVARRKARATPISCWMRSASRSAATSRPSACGAQPARASAASGECTCRGVWRAKSCADRHRANSPNTRAIPRGASRSAQATRCLPPLTARRSCRTSTAGAATARSRTSATSSSSPMPRPGCTTRAARCASRSTCRSTSATSTWCTRTSATPTSRSWARSRAPRAPPIPSRCAGCCSGPTSSRVTA